MNKFSIRFMKRKKFRLIPNFSYCKFGVEHPGIDSMYKNMLELSMLWLGYGVSFRIPRSGWLKDNPNDTFNFFDKSTY